ncbi:hypothetical protein GW17_00032837 [Ensete ventricosum]|nr:hypothetical protein GW17_00032837 [Ensete ventricosum]
MHLGRWLLGAAQRCCLAACPNLKRKHSLLQKKQGEELTRYVELKNPRSSIKCSLGVSDEIRCAILLP